MPDVPSRPTASSFSAGLPTETGLSPLQWSDKCFLCSNDIGESDPRGFYQGSATMMLCHRGCLNIMDTHGGAPADYHRAMTGQEGPSEPAVAPNGPSWLDFPDLTALQAYVSTRGIIARDVKVTVGKVVLQSGQ